MSNGSQAGTATGTVPAVPAICANDDPIDDTSALIYSEKAPLPVTASIQTARGVRTKDDYKAVWTFVPDAHDVSLLLFFHGNNNYVTVSRSGRSRAPDWADATATAAANKKKAAGLQYGLNNLNSSQAALATSAGVVKKPLVLIPEDAELTSGSFWAVPPKKQYGSSSSGVGTTIFEELVMDAYKHLRCLKGPGGNAYLPSGVKGSYASNLKRIYVSGHSGGGKPLVECAGADLVRISPTSIDLPTDLWLMDCTYGFGIDNHVSFCKNWNDNGKLAFKADSSRFICVYRPKQVTPLWEDKAQTIPKIDPKTGKQAVMISDTESEADALRDRIAKEVLKVVPATLLKNMVGKTEADILTALTAGAPVVFIRTGIDHDDIPTKFIPMMLRTAVS
jgi:hypothetical protein